MFVLMDKRRAILFSLAYGLRHAVTGLTWKTGEKDEAMAAAEQLLRHLDASNIKLKQGALDRHHSFPWLDEADDTKIGPAYGKLETETPKPGRTGRR